MNLPPDPLELMSGGYQAACVLGAAAELDLFRALGDEALDAPGLAARVDADLRGLTILADALAGLGLLEKADGRYSVPPALRRLLRADTAESVLPGIWHRMNVIRSWTSLAWAAKAGMPAPRTASLRGPGADLNAFVASMHTYSRGVAAEVIGRFGPPRFRRLLDVGGASGTWTLALLEACPGSEAVIFDLPHAVAQARARIGAGPFGSRVGFAAGDFYVDELPTGFDLAWVSAIVHQNSRAQNRELFAKVARALEPGGRIAIRDFVMDADRTRPLGGAFFAVNMLVNTPKGGTFTFEELAADLEAAGFTGAELAVHDETMNSVVVATRG